MRRALLGATAFALLLLDSCSLSMEGKDHCITTADCLDDYHCADGRCRPGSCNRSCEGKQCGDDGCGGECSTCPGGMSCNAATYKCESCQPDCTFNGSDKSCGSSGCVGLVCGSCSDGKHCNPGNFRCEYGGSDAGSAGPSDAGAVWPRDSGSVGPSDAGFVGIDAGSIMGDAGSCSRSCEGKQCGDDGCGGQCSTCPESMSCNWATHKCEPCQPQCTFQGKEMQCGPAGCSGLSCGKCADWRYCSADFVCALDEGDAGAAGGPDSGGP
jgi:hypothetical protein